MRAKSGRIFKGRKTPLFFAADDRLCGIIAVADTIKEDSPEAVGQLKIWVSELLCSPVTTSRLPMLLESRREWTKSSQVMLPDGKGGCHKEAKKRAG